MMEEAFGRQVAQKGLADGEKKNIGIGRKKGLSKQEKG